MVKKTLLLVTCFAALTACSSEQGPTPVQSPWNEIALSENTWWSADSDFRSQTYEIVLDAFAGLEFKLGMKTGDMIVYEWTADVSAPELLLSEFHGHTERQGTEPGDLMFYSKHTQGQERGALRSPFDGIHGWYLKNNGLDTIVVQLRVAGFYEDVEQ